MVETSLLHLIAAKVATLCRISLQGGWSCGAFGSLAS